MKTVNVRNLILGDGKAKICVPVVAREEDQLREDAVRISNSEADLIEFRADYYKGDEQKALEILRTIAGEKPILYTIRTREEGGETEIGREEYEARNMRAAVIADMVDVQIDRVCPDAGPETCAGDSLILRLQRAGAVVVGSWHNFEMTPRADEMVNKVLVMQRAGCDVSKIAVMPGCREDVIELLAASVRLLEKEADRPFITMSMGEYGKISRVCGAFSGSAVTFGAVGEGSAPGQLPARELREILDLLGN